MVLRVPLVNIIIYWLILSFTGMLSSKK